MNDKRRKYGAAASVQCELLDRFPTYIPRIEEELVYKLTDPIIKEAIKGECIVRFTETEQREDFTTDLIEFHKSVCVEEIVRCFECKAFMLKAEKPRYMCCKFNGLTDPKPNDFCSYGERRNDEADLCRDGTRDARSV